MAGSKRFVAGAGSVNVDLIYSGLPRIPAEGEELFSQGFTLQMGGGLPAVLINLSRLGVPVRIQTGLGNDPFSDFACRAFEQAGVMPLNLCPDTAGIPVNLSTVMLTPNDRTFVTFTDGCPTDDAAQELIYKNSTGAAICLMDTRYPAVYEKLRREGTMLVLDTGWDDEMSIKKYRRLLELADYYTPNQKEAMKITGTASPQEAARVLGDFFDQVIVKLDSAGCLIQENGVQSIIPVIPGIQHRDSTGAGDAFLAGLIYGLYHGESLAKSVLYGNITGGKCVTAVGCLTAYCTEAELLETAKKYIGLLP